MVLDQQSATNLPTIEVHIFDFDSNIYGKNLRVQVVKELRPEMKFDDISQLSERLSKDKQSAKSVLSNYSDSL